MFFFRAHRSIFVKSIVLSLGLFLWSTASLPALAQTMPIAAPTAARLPDGTLAVSQTGSRVYYIENATKRWVLSEESFRYHGLRWSDVVTVSEAQLSQFPEGDTITSETKIVLPSEANSLPDLAPYAAQDFSFVQKGDQVLLRFTAKFWNRGKGRFELSTDPGAVATDGDRPAVQSIFRPDGTHRDASVGTIFWHQIHGHFHYNDFGDYTLQMVRTADGQTPAFTMPTLTQKTTYCMRDDEAATVSPEGIRQARTYKGCGGQRQGVSVGWVDIYRSTLPDQNFTVTTLPPGLYRLSFVVDPRKHFVESRWDNNESSTFIQLDVQNRIVKTIASAAPFVTPANRFPDGMLLRNQGSDELSVMRNNKKRLLRSDEVFASYGYELNKVISLPQSIIAALPRDMMVRVKGTNAIYMINEQGYRRHIGSPTVFFSYGADFAEINQTEFDSYRESNLIMRQGDATVYLVTGATKRAIGSAASLPQFGFDPAMVHLVNETDFKAFATTGEATPQAAVPTVQTVATNLVIPWDIAFLPDGDMLVTERTGTVRRIGAHPAAMQIPSVLRNGEGGLMGIALHPQFAENKFVYLYFTTDTVRKNRVSRFRLDGDTLADEKIIIDNIPASLYHDGGQLAFGPDGMLYITTGDAEMPSSAQDLKSLSGKTLRLTADGSIPTDNPFGTGVWSYGHRNAQGIAWDAQGRMWQTEHGRSGVLSGFDELNLVEKGKNYGWPLIQGDETAVGMVTPVRNSGANDTWAPSGLAFVDGKLYFAGLRGSSLYAATVGSNGTVTDFHSYLSGTYGRLRAVVVGPEGDLYLTTSNRDGRGTVRAGDDKILRVKKQLLGGS